MVNRHQMDLQKEIEPVKHICLEMRSALDEIATREKQLQSRKEEKLQTIQSTFDSFLDIIEQERKYITESVNDSFRKPELLYSDKRKEVSRELEALESIASSVMPRESKIEFLRSISNRKRITKHAYQSAHDVTLYPDRSPEMEVEILSPVDLKTLFQERNFLHQKGDVTNGHLQRSFDPANVPSDIQIYLNPKKSFLGRIGLVVELHHCNPTSIQKVNVKKVAANEYSFSFPTTSLRGRTELHIKYDNMHICGSPIPVNITIHPDQIRTIRPKITPLNNAAGIKYHRGKLFVSVEEKLLLLNASSKIIERDLEVPRIVEVLINDSSIYATDVIQHRLIKMDMNGTILKTTGREGGNPGEFNFPNGIQLSKDNEIYVCDSNNHRIQIFDRDLNLLRVIGERRGTFNSPCDLDFDDTGNMYVAEQDNHRIQVLTPHGQHIRNIGNYGSIPGKLNSPISTAVKNNMVYVTDCYNKRISVFQITGELVTTFGKDILLHPEGIAIDDDGYIHVTDSRERLVTF